MIKITIISDNFGEMINILLSREQVDSFGEMIIILLSREQVYTAKCIIKFDITYGKHRDVDEGRS